MGQRAVKLFEFLDTLPPLPDPLPAERTSSVEAGRIPTRIAEPLVHAATHKIQACVTAAHPEYSKRLPTHRADWCQAGRLALPPAEVVQNDDVVRSLDRNQTFLGTGANRSPSIGPSNRQWAVLRSTPSAPTKLNVRERR